MSTGFARQFNMKLFFLLILLCHGFIHFLGFAKAFDLGNISTLTQEISKPNGMVWLLVGLGFSIAAFAAFNDSEHWPILVIALAITSEILILLSWQDARYGTFINALAITVALLAFSTRKFEASFVNDVEAAISEAKTLTPKILVEADLAHLPAPVQRYIRYSGALGKPNIQSLRVEFDGEMRGRGQEWFKFNSLQYNFFPNPTRLFFMSGRFFGVTVPGYHRYAMASAKMNIKLFGIIPIIEKSGEEMNIAETVTLFNDMCLLAPESLIDRRISWEVLSDRSVRGSLNNTGIQVAAVLYFNESDQLVNFVSEDRYSIDDMKKYRFSTPLSKYQKLNDRNIATYGETIWHYPEGDFTYGRFYLKSIKYSPNRYWK
jgi:hypothetical protein